MPGMTNVHKVDGRHALKHRGKVGKVRRDILGSDERPDTGEVNALNRARGIGLIKTVVL